MQRNIKKGTDILPEDTSVKSLGVGGNSGENIKPSRYTLQVGKDGEQRLNILNSLYNPLSQLFLTKAGVTNCQSILDVACGTGEMTCWMAQQTKGKVLAVDISEQQLEIGRRNAEALGIKNIEFRQLSAFDLDKINESFDLIYCRFLLVHIQRPEDVVQAMYRRLSQNGIITCEEATVSVSFCYPQSPAFDKWLQLWAGLRKANETDMDLGLKLPQMFKNASFVDVKAQLVQPVLSTTDEKRLLKLNAKEATNAAVDAGVATKEAMLQLADDLEALAKDENCFIGYVRNTQVWGQKKPISPDTST
jgi:ubiquinone/menaquinone biosynthesis C-methylase UbiE